MLAVIEATVRYPQLAATAMAVLLATCSSSSNDGGADGPSSNEAPVVHAAGKPAADKQVFRFELFGNKRFWTDALQLQQGMMATGTTPLQALKLGLMIDLEALDAPTQAALAAEGETDLFPAHAPMLNDPQTTVEMINANAVIGIVGIDSGSFDDTVDGNGDPQHNSALFRTDLAAPWGTDGTIARLENFSNLVYTALLDPTIVTSPRGRAFLRKFGGTAAGSEIADGYVQVLAVTGVTG